MYALSDFQVNNRTEKSVREDLINYLLLGNFSDEGEKSIRNNTLEELLNYYEFTLLKSEKRFDENKQYDLDVYSINGVQLIKICNSF